MPPTATVALPSRIRALPRDRHGRPIPWFVATLASGERDFRIAGGDRRTIAVRQRLCWVCGQPLPKRFVFALGPMCAINRVTGEPPVHDVCGVYSMQACPFLATPQMTRRTRGMPAGEDLVGPAGLHAEGNPGGAILWTTTTYTPIQLPIGGLGRAGMLFRVGAPAAVSWWHQGRPATRDEATALLDSALGKLRAEAARDRDPSAAQALLDKQYAAARRLLPIAHTGGAA